MVMVSPRAPVVAGRTAIRRDDARPSLGISVGSFAAIGITLSKGMTTGFWAETLILIGLDTAVPLTTGVTGGRHHRQKGNHHGRSRLVPGLAEPRCGASPNPRSSNPH